MNQLPRFLSVSCWLWLTPLFVHAQDSTRHQLRAFAEVGTLLSSNPDRVPFWLTANQFGIFPKQPQTGLGQVGLRYKTALGRSAKWGAEAAVEAVVQSNNPDVRVILPQGFARIFYKNWEFVAGRRREIIGSQDSTLSSGGTLWSGNALPMPMLRLGTSDYIRLPILKHWLQVKGVFAHGWFENSRPFSKDVFLHYKSLYLKFGKDTWPVSFWGGLVHMVQWGGYAPALKNDNGVLSNFGYFDSSLQGYIDVVLGRSHQDLSLPDGSALPGTSIASIDVNRTGNHIATLDVNMELKFPRSRLLFYRQHFIEDGSFYYLKNIADGLNGIRWYRTVPPAAPFSIQRVTVEFLYSLSQSGSEFVIEDPLRRGRDNYFNHSQYQDGWSYFRRAIGTPFIPPDADLTGKLVRNYLFTSDNRVMVFHAGLGGTAFRKLAWETKFSYGLNYGTYDTPINPAVPQFSGLVRAGLPLPYLGGLEVRGSVAWDYGSLYDDAYGAYLGIRKSWNSSQPRARKPAPAPTPSRRFGF